MSNTAKASNALVASVDFYASALAAEMKRAEQAEAIRDQLAKQIQTMQVRINAGSAFAARLGQYVLSLHHGAEFKPSDLDRMLADFVSSPVQDTP